MNERNPDDHGDEAEPNGPYGPYAANPQNPAGDSADPGGVNGDGQAANAQQPAEQQGTGGYYYAQYTYSRYAQSADGSYNQQNQYGNPYGQNPYGQNQYGQQGPYDQQNPYTQQYPNAQPGPQPGGQSHFHLADPFKLFANAMSNRGRKTIRVMYGVIGVAAVLLGVALLVWPGRTLTVATFILGVYFVISGVMRAISAITESSLPAGWRVLDVLIGVLLAIGGVIVIKNMTLSATTMLVIVTLVVGIGWISEGLMALLESWKLPKSGWAIAYAVISIIAGLVILFSPMSSAVWLMVFAGIALIAIGIVAIVRAFTFGRGSDDQ